MAFLLDRLSLSAIVDGAGRPLQAFQRLWQKNCELTERQEATQDGILAEILAMQSDIIDALAAAGIALDTAEAGYREAARIGSYTDPSSVLSAADVGTDCTITIAAHTRVYPVKGAVDVDDLSVAGGTIAGQPFATDIYVYYDDASLTDATPSYLATDDPATSQVGAAAGRHFVGKITTPADGAGGTTGTGGSPPGGGGTTSNPLP